MCSPGEILKNTKVRKKVELQQIVSWETVSLLPSVEESTVF